MRNAPAYEDWVLHQRENLHGMVLRGLSQTTDRCIAEGEYEAGLEMTRRLLTLEPWQEQSHRQRLLLLAYTNQRSAAMAQYEVCRSILWEEFGVEPMPETTALYEKIKTSEIAPPIPAPATHVVAHGWLGRLTGFVRSTLAHPDTAQPTHTVGFIDWDAIPDPPPLIGREEEASRLARWLDTDRSRLIGVHGLGGQGKSALVATVIHSLFGPSAMAVHTQNSHEAKETYGHSNGVATASGKFQVVLWHSLATAPNLRQWAHHWIAFLANREIDLSTMSSDELVATIIECLRRWRCLIVLDDVDGILQAEGNAGEVAADQAIYAELFKRVGSSNHQSSLVVISRDSLVDVEGLARSQERNVKNLWLGPLPNQASQAWLAVLGVSGDPSVLEEIAERYSGNPLALGIVADTIRKLHFDDGRSFLDSQVVAFDAIRAVIDEQFARLSRLEGEMMGVLALTQKAVTWSDLGQSLRSARPQQEIVEAQLSLLRRGLVNSQPTGITLPSLIRGYMQEREAMI
ncbi:MAG: BTAD domain-containing putative transcriptional regulator [Schleiferiaceae bacterium]